MLKDKKIIVAISGGIAAYKAADLVRAFVKKGAFVKVIMTENATKFITPLTLQTLSSNPVFIDMFSLIKESEISHISLAQYADIFVVAPATANVIGKIASGIADDLLTTTIMATKSPVLICPAMNTNMYTNAIVQENIAKLALRGYYFVDPQCGELACKATGSGRLAESSDIIEEVECILTEKDLVGERVLVTAGPTREPLDPVRYISNYSSGKMGYALATAARRRGADVLLISGPTSLKPPRGVKLVPVESAVEMQTAVMNCLADSTIIIKAAAVADYRPAILSKTKIKKRRGPLVISLERNPDIIFEAGKKKKKNQVLVGFAMESEDLIENAQKKLKDKRMDFIVANDLTQEGAGFQSDTNVVKIIDKQGSIKDLPKMGKIEVANAIFDCVKQIRAKSNE
jgi:phosphopantothenoylcysteine decarboxylase/phosphopantothenate--cysteine ligase